MDVLASAVSAAFDALPQIRRDEIAQLLDATDAAIKGTANNSSTLAAVKRTLLEELGLTVEETARAAESRRTDSKWMVTGQPASVWSVDSCKGAWRAVRDVLEVKKEPKRVASSSPPGSSMRKRVRAEPQEQQPQEQQPPQLADVENATDLSAPSDEDQLHADENSIARPAVTSKKDLEPAMRNLDSHTALKEVRDVLSCQAVCVWKGMQVTSLACCRPNVYARCCGKPVTLWLTASCTRSWGSCWASCCCCQRSQ